MRRDMIDLFYLLHAKINNFFKILFYKDVYPKELPQPLKPFSITTMFPSSDVMRDAINKSYGN